MITGVMANRAAILDPVNHRWIVLRLRIMAPRLTLHDRKARNYVSAVLLARLWREHSLLSGERCIVFAEKYLLCIAHEYNIESMNAHQSSILDMKHRFITIDIFNYLF
mmetsp:Transcript_11772/g.20715  ORF Transcript_11772/g.20715 Transcript_11772/m.20715 type:complete len:108 (-) Transcript_11772:6-329(-)